MIGSNYYSRKEMHACILGESHYKGYRKPPFRVENSSRLKLCEFKTLTDSQLSINTCSYSFRSTAWSLRSKPSPSLRSMDPASHEATTKVKEGQSALFLASKINVSTKGKNGCMHYTKRGKHNCIGVHCCIINLSS